MILTANLNQKIVFVSAHVKQDLQNIPYASMAGLHGLAEEASRSKCNYRQDRYKEIYHELEMVDVSIKAMRDLNTSDRILVELLEGLNGLAGYCGR
jgi:hypothetical protein